MTIRWLFGAVAAFIFAPVLAASPISVPTEMCRDYFFVPITLQARAGYPENRTLWFLYDTGASATYVDPESIARVVGREIDAKQVNIVDATAGPVRINRLSARITDLNHLSIALGREIDGILAFSAFAQFLTTLDYETGSITLTEGALPRPDGETVFSASGRDHRPWLDVRLDGRRYRLLIDSGAASTPVRLEDIDRFQTLASPRPTESTTGFDEIRRHRGARLDGDLTIGPHRFAQPLLTETDGTPLIGGEVMTHFQWTFDQRHERVQITRRDVNSPLAMDSFKSHGIAMVGRAGALHVFDLIPNTPAADAGLEKGDVITHINGLPVASRGCDSMNDADKLALTVKRDDDVRELVVDLTVLVE